MSKIGFIGMGNMAQALAEGWVNMGAVDDGLYAYARKERNDYLL